MDDSNVEVNRATGKGNAWWRSPVLTLVWITLPLWLSPLGWWLAFRPSAVLSFLGMIVFIIGDMAFLIASLVYLFLILITPVRLCLAKYRKGALITAGQAVVFVACYVVGSFNWGRELWYQGVVDVVARGDPLIDAIHAYTSDHGQPPGSLQALTPQYLAAIPTTGVGSRSKFHYVVGEPQHFDGNPWVVFMSPPCHVMGFDRLMYFPLENYPTHGYGGWIRRIGRWGYVHE